MATPQSRNQKSGAAGTKVVSHNSLRVVFRHILTIRVRHLGPLSLSIALFSGKVQLVDVLSCNMAGIKSGQKEDRKESERGYHEHLYVNKRYAADSELDQAAVDDLLTVEDHIVPRDWANMLDQRPIQIHRRIALQEQPVDLLGLPGDDKGKDQRQCTAGVALFQPIPFVEPASLSIVEIPS